jgi:prepilin-type N-terminal cleavage/methylation domain-containing protein
VDQLKPAGGFTLIELMITLTVLGTGCSPCSCSDAGARRRRARQAHQGAAMVAQDQLERINSRPTATIISSRTIGRRPGSATPAIGSGEAVAVRVAQPGGAVIEKVYTVFYQVIADPGGNSDLRLLDLEVVWDEAKISNNRPTRTGKPTVALSTLLVNNDK